MSFCVSIWTCLWHNNWKIIVGVLRCVGVVTVWPQAHCNVQITHSGLGSKHQYIDINGADIQIPVFRFGEKQRKNSPDFSVGVHVLFYPHISSLFPDSLFFCQKHHGEPPVPQNTFSSLHSSLCPLPHFFSFRSSVYKTERSYNLDILQMYCFQLYKLCLFTLPSSLEHGLLASELQPLGTFSKLSYPKENCPMI